MMYFNKLNFNNEVIETKTRNMMALVNRIRKEGPIRLSVKDIESEIGTGKVGDCLRLCLVKVKGSNYTGAATWDVNMVQVAELVKLYKNWLDHSYDRNNGAQVLMQADAIKKNYINKVNAAKELEKTANKIPV